MRKFNRDSVEILLVWLLIAILTAVAVTVVVLGFQIIIEIWNSKE